MRAAAALLVAGTLATVVAGCSSSGDDEFTPAAPGSRARPNVVAGELPSLGQFIRLADGSQVSSVSADYLFDAGSDQLRPEAVTAIEKVIPAIKVHDGDVEILGYTDGLGDAEFNKELSLRRAKAVEQLLIQGGVPESMLEPVGMGEEGSEDNVPDSTKRKVEIVLK